MHATLSRMGREKKEPTEQVRLPKSFVRRLRRLAGHLDKDPQEYIVEKLESPLSRDEAQMLKDLQKEQSRVGD